MINRRLYLVSPIEIQGLLIVLYMLDSYSSQDNRDNKSVLQRAQDNRDNRDGKTISMARQ